MNSLDAAIAVTGITLTSQSVGVTGCRIIAFFDVTAFGIEIRGCKFIRTEKDGITVTAPTLDDKREARARRSVRFQNDLVRSAIIRAARRSYLALGGTGLPEWAMRAEEFPSRDGTSPSRMVRPDGNLPRGDAAQLGESET